MKKGGTNFTISEGLGIGAYIFGGIILFFAAIFLFIEMYTAGIICLIPAFILISFRSGTSVDISNKEILHKWGFFVAFITKNSSSILEAKAVVVSRHVSKVRTSMRPAPPDFHVEIELPDKKVRVWEFYEQEKAWQFAIELSDTLKVNYYQGSEINY